ncbi:hypothetical protein [Fodinicola acaciae]|uniref:hypothetical protein n=1 Tax=Fodinicola acaciae TaxID=2681555 RepID=UPI0013D7A251|nr:hypothetical protein [Fodinicola acaciae]
MKMTLIGTHRELAVALQTVRLLFHISEKSEPHQGAGPGGVHRFTIYLDVIPLLDTSPDGYPDESQRPRRHPQ